MKWDEKNCYRRGRMHFNAFFVNAKVNWWPLPNGCGRSNVMIHDKKGKKPKWKLQWRTMREMFEEKTRARVTREIQKEVKEEIRQLEFSTNANNKVSETVLLRMGKRRKVINGNEMNVKSAGSKLGSLLFLAAKENDWQTTGWIHLKGAIPRENLRKLLQCCSSIKTSCHCSQTEPSIFL